MFNSGRRRAIKSLDVEISRAKRFGYYVGILLLDVDASIPRGVHKDLPGVTVNVEHIRNLLREYDIVFKTKLRRYTVILPHLEEGESARVVRDRLKFTSWIKEWGSVNIGIAIYPVQGQSSKELFKAAERDLKDTIAEDLSEEGKTY
ncbi:hypothetical protein KKA00_01215 [bacterium]|nr:hypothetical protein [bacterium]MBU1650812.1 hypothetical protein [bacterium]MBU1880552.1 hypothetical protein [bacterium]